MQITLLVAFYAIKTAFTYSKRLFVWSGSGGGNGRAFQ